MEGERDGGRGQLSTVVSLQPFFMLHDPPQHLESVAHIMNCCGSLKGLFIARHDRLIDLGLANLIAAQTPGTEDEQTHTHTTVRPEWYNSSADTFSGIANTPDASTISQKDKKVQMFEISSVFWKNHTVQKK